MTLPKKRYIKKAIKKITVVWLLFFYLVPWSGVLALTETTHSFPTDTSFSAEGYSDDFGNVVVSPTEIKLNIKQDWWNESYLYKRNLTVRNIGTTASLSPGTPIQATVDLTTLGLGTTKLQTDLDDLRVVYSVGATHTQISRSYYLDVGNTAVATLTFPLQTELGMGATNTNYSIYYGNSEAVYDLGSGFDFEREGEDANATMVCPFDGTTTCKTGQTPSAESGAIRYSAESGSAIQFDGFNDYIQLPNTDSSLHITNDITLEAWINIPSGGGGGIFGAENCWDYQQFYVSSSAINYRNYEGGLYWSTNASYSFNPNQWYHIAMVGDRTNHIVRLYINGNEVVSEERTESYWPISASNDQTIIGKQCGSGTEFFRGLMDEVRISNSVRYTENFTPDTKPFAVDGNTRLLLHFDENGDDPRMTGKAIDVSGNGNHGTNNGAKYVGGLVGVDPLASSGQVLMQSTGSHSGIFVEEGTTNLVSNPSFEHSTYNTGWSKPYVNLGDGTTAFTPNVSKRNSAGPFGQGIMLTNSLVGGTSPGDSNITMSGSTQVATSFYDRRDENQGTMVFWITPEWDGDDNLVHYIFGRGTDFGLLKDSDNYLHLYDYGDQELFDISDWQAGETYNVVIRWSLNKKIGNSNYNFLVDVNGVSKYVSESSFVVGGFLNRFNPSNSIIEGMTMYRRPLWDGSYGIDVGNGDEIEQIYNNGSGRDPTLVTGSWDVVFALPTDSTGGVLDVGGTGQAWTHPYASNKIYTSTTNTGGFMMGGEMDDDGWIQEGAVGDADSVEYNATTTLVNAGSDTNIDNLHDGAMTVEGWIRNDNWGEGEGGLFGYIVNKSGTSGWRLQVYKNGGIFGTVNTDGTDAASLSGIDEFTNDGLWHHVAFTYDDGGDRKIDIYIDGVEVSSYVVQTAAIGTVDDDSSGDLFIGNSQYLAYTFDGAIGWLRLSNTVRYSGSFTPSSRWSPPVGDSNTVAQWNMDEGTGTSVSNDGGASSCGGTPSNCNGTLSNGSWNDGGALTAAEKIYSGGYKWTSNDYNQGIGYTLTGLTAGQNYVVRALANSGDGVGQPKIFIYDNTNGSDITSFVGTTASTRTDPDVMLFTFELPTVARYASDANYSWVVSDTASITVKLVNANNLGSVHFHQMELLENLIDNPSLEIGSSDPWIPAAWSKYNDLSSGESVQETVSVNSGLSAFKLTDDGLTTEGIATPKSSFQGGSFYSLGFSAKKDTEGSATFEVSGSSSQILKNASSSPYSVFLGSETSSDYKDIMSVFRQREDRSANFNFFNHHTGELDAYIDDVYVYKLKSINLLITPASLANSTEETGLRVDGADSLTQTISGLSANNGMIKFTFTPRHNFDIGSSFGVANPVIMQAYADDNNYIKLHKSNSTTLQLIGMFGGTQVSVGWTNPTLNAGTSYPIVISYQSGGNLSLKVNNVNVGTTSGVVNFGTAPTTLYWGTDNGGGGSNPYDGTFRGISAMSVEENTSSPYYKYGSKSLKFTASTDNDQYTIDVGVSATNTLSAYVYDITSGNVGGTISSSVAQLYFDNEAIGTTYMDTGGGWWRLMGQVTGVGTTVKAGVEVKANKTVYVDGVQMEEKTYATSFTNGSLGVGYSWGGTANASVSSRAYDFIRYAGAIGSTDTSGTVSFWVKPDWDSVLNRPTGQWKYLPYIKVGSGGFGWGNGFMISTYTDNVSSSLNNFRISNFGAESESIDLTIPMSRNSWRHLVYSWGDNKSSVYVDGGLYKDVDNVFINHTDDGNVEINNYGNANSVVSDLRFFDEALTESEASNLYNSGLASHTGGSEEIDRYRESGVYTSSVVDLGNNGSWGSSAFQATESLGVGTSTAYSTRTSADNNTWGDWVNVGVGGSIGSTPLKYFQWKATLTSSTDQSQTPQISGMVVSYVGDASAPGNPTAQATGFSAGVGTTSIGSGGTNWYNYESPYFSWPAGEDAAGEGQSASGVDGYHVLFTQDVGSTPVDNISDDCYAWVDDSDGESGGSVRLGYGELSSCTLSDGVYYLLIQTKDNSGNVATPSQLFTYQFDSSNPSAPTIVTSTTVGYKSTNEFGFIWPAAVDQGPAGIAGYEYKTGSTDESDPFSSWQYTSDTGATNVVAYTEGQNFFYVRSVDKAGNKSATTTNLGVSPFYFNESAPTEPRNVTIAPVTSSSLPAASNVFTVSWDKPETFSGDIAKYYYCVNCVPSADNMTETTAAETVNRSLSNLALATQQGKNTFYIVAEDNNVNSETGTGNRNFEAYASVDFWASTTAPGAPTGLAVTDASDRTLSKWRLTLTWIEPVSGSEVDVYYIYRSIDNSNFSKIGEVSSTAYTDTDLVQSKVYYYKVYAVDNAKSLSLASSTVSLAPEGKYSDPPVAGGAPSVVTGSSTATLTWTTSRSAYGTVEYGKTTSYGQAASETATATSHSIKLTGLTSGTTYHYRVQNLDDSSMVGYSRSAAYSTDYSFTTLSAAEISDVEIKDTGLDFAIISWKTRTTSSSEVVYGKTLDYGRSVVVSTSTDETEHTVRLEDLEHSNTYHFKIKGTTVDGDDIESQDITFSTVTFPKLTSYVVKTDQSTGGTTIAAAWSTNVKTSSVLEYQRAEIVGDYSIDELEQMSQTELARVPIKIIGEVEEVAKNDLSFDHVIRAGSLEDGSIYVLRIKGRDVYGNEMVSDAVRYVTGKDTRAPVISNVSVETQLSGSGIDSKAQILVSWETDEEASSQVIYGHGTGSEYQMSTSEDKSKKIRHIVVIRDLEPNSSYHLKAVSSDSMGNTIYSQDIIAVTPSTSESALDIVLIQLEEIFGFLNF